ncbi:hypothetical protein Ahy_A09g046746 isoform B [Arachis hypogaea]|uniref:Uncharacterized protein n=2 Tax=Arachis TaxID=3817 RepID=A0A445BQP0_ARAHY|nr:hypothetical protein Ahy_A09g046746 isoform B [Arachis hypogaea]
MEVAASTTPTWSWWGRHSTLPSFPRKTSFLRLHPRFPNFTGLGAACGSRRSSEVNVSPWDDKPFEMLLNGKRVYFDEQDVVTFLDPPNELVPLDPSSYNPAAYLWKKIEDIPEERRHRLLLLLKPRLVSIAWQIAGSRYEDSKLVKKSASQLFANSNKDDVMLEYYNCRTTGGPMPLSWINSYRKAIFSCTDGKAYGRLIGGSILAPFADSFAPLYFALRDIKEVMPTEQPCDLAYEFGDGLFDVKEFPQGFPKPVKHPYPFNDQLVIYIRHIGPGVCIGQAWQEGTRIEQVPRKLCSEILMVKDYRSLLVSIAWQIAGGSILAPFADSFAPLYFAPRDIKEVMSTEQPCDLAYEFGDGLFDVKEFPQCFPKPGPGVCIGQAWQEGTKIEQVPRKLCSEILMTESIKHKKNKALHNDNKVMDSRDSVGNPSPKRYPKCKPSLSDYRLGLINRISDEQLGRPKWNGLKDDDRGKLIKSLFDQVKGKNPHKTKIAVKKPIQSASATYKKPYTIHQITPNREKLILVIHMIITESASGEETSNFKRLRGESSAGVPQHGTMAYYESILALFIVQAQQSIARANDEAEASSLIGNYFGGFMWRVLHHRSYGEHSDYGV